MSLTPTQKLHFREEIADFCALAESYERRWHYTQHRPYTGLGVAPQTYHYDDCSAYCALVFWWAAHHVAGVSVADPLGMHFSGWGWTGSALSFLQAHHAPVDKYLIGDMAIFGTLSLTVHMMVCRKAGTATSAVWSSHGSEAGPSARELGYHPSPLVGVYRHPALL